MNLGSLTRQTGIRLNRRFRSAHAFTGEARPIEAANASLSGAEHRAGIFDPARARLWLLGGGDPVDPISARVARDVRPQRSRLRGGGRERLAQICRHRGFRFLYRGRDLESDSVACLCARGFAQLPVHFKPVAFLAVGLERGLKRKAIDGAFDRRHAPGGELRTGVRWQSEKGPRAGLLALGRPEEFGFETDRFGHCLTTVIGMRFLKKSRSQSVNRDGVGSNFLTRQSTVHSHENALAWHSSHLQDCAVWAPIRQARER